MEIVETILSALGLKFKTVVAGAIGSFISLRFFDDLNIISRWTTAIGGCAMASYWAEGFAYFLGLHTVPSLETGLALAIALLGMAVVAACIKAIRDTDWPGILKSIASIRFGGGNK